jgi:hypothetical protein
VTKEPRSRTQTVVNMGDQNVTAQRVDSLTINIGEKALWRLENPEAFYRPVQPRPTLTEGEQQSNIERKMANFSRNIRRHARCRRVDVLILLEKYGSLSEYSEQHLDFIMQCLQDLYHEVYVAQLNQTGNHWAAYQALLGRFDEFAAQYNFPNRLPLSKNSVIGLLFNATGLCDIDWTP